MAITAVPSNQSAPAIPVRAPVPAANSQREQTLATPPSAITRISTEGKLRSELERAQVVEPTQNNAAPYANTVPRRSADEAVVNVNVVIPAPSPSVPSRPVDKVEVTEPVVESTARASRRAQPQVIRPAPPPERTDVPAATVVNRAGIQSSSISPSVAAPLEPSRVSQNATTPVTQTPPATKAPSALSLPTNTALPTQAPAAGERANSVKISRTASEFVAAFNETQSQRNPVSDSTTLVKQTQVAKALGVQVSTQRQSGADVNISTFTAGVARNSSAQKIDPNNAPALSAKEDTNDTRRLVHAAVAQGESNQSPTSRNVGALTETDKQAQTRPSAVRQNLQNAVQKNSEAVSLDGAGLGQSGLAKRLNVLANLITP